LFIEEHVGEPVVLVGHSLGAMTATRLAASRPDLVKGLVAINATARAESKDRLPDWRALEQQLAEGDYKARRQALADVQKRLLPQAFLGRAGAGDRRQA
jgi:pimeloyl-ACP methyl ester carboxylesterase